MSGDTAALTFKAGRVEYDETTKQATPLAGSGQVIVQRKPDDPMFCSLTWERRATKGKPLGTSTPEEEFEELLLFPGDAEWNHVKECTTGRVFELKFKSSGQRHVFWMQAPTSDSNLSTLSNEDKTIAEQMKQFLEEEGAAEDEEMDDADSETAPTRSANHLPRSTAATSATPARTSSESLSQVYELIQNVRRNRDRLRQGSGSGSTSTSAPQDNDNGLAQVPILSITDAISNTDMANYVSSLPDDQLTPLYNFIPAELPKNRTELIKIIQSPQFLQSLSSFDSVLSQPGAGSVVASQLGYSYQGEGVQGFLDGVRHASKADQSSQDHDMDTEPNDK